jgi:undecaprenyl-diphosphatase
MVILLLIFLGIVQGLTEFLPVSSSAHLALLQSVFRFSESQRLSYAAFLHLGTTLAIVFFFRQKIYEIFVNLFKRNDQGQQKDSLSLILMIIIGTIPVAILGYLAKDKINQVFDQPIYSAIFLFVTGVILFTTKFAKEHKSRASFSDALLIGIAQAIALLPGISRSGITISTALLLGLSRENGFEFSFLLSIPAVIGANILELKELSIHFSKIHLILALILPFISGLIALRLLKSFVIRKQLYYFSYYCWILGIVALIIILH